MTGKQKESSANKQSWDKRIKNKSVQELKGLMHDATYHIKLYFWSVLGDIEL